MTILLILLVALLIALLFRLLHRLLRPLARRQPFWLRVSYLLMGIELLAWTGWLFWVIRRVVHNQAVYAYFTIGVAFLLFGLLTWFLLRDVVAGIIFKLQHNLKINQSIRVAGNPGGVLPVAGIPTPDAAGGTGPGGGSGGSHPLLSGSGITGRLLNLGITTITLESTTGDRIKIPYTKLINETVARHEASDMIKPFDMMLQVPKSMSKDRWIVALRRQVLLLPWASTIRVPVVQWKREDEQQHTFNLRIYCLSDEQAHRVESHLRHVYTDQSSG